MKNWLKKYAMASILSAAFFALGLFLRALTADRDTALWKSLVLTPEPEICALCGNGNGMPYHAPVLVDLSTGEIGEMQVYDPDPVHRYELAEEQSTGTFSLLYVAGLTGCRDTCEHSCDVTLPEKGGQIDPTHFCRNCRAVLAGIDTEGYILADLHNLSDIAAYTIAGRSEYTIRDYAVSISDQEESHGLSIHVTGLLFMGEG